MSTYGEMNSVIVYCRNIVHRNIAEVLISKIFFDTVFLSSWTERICDFKFPFCAKLALQISHLNGLFPSWTDQKWLPKFDFWE